VNRVFRWTQILALVCLASQVFADATHSNRKALVIGRGDPFRDPGGGITHPQFAKNNFLTYVGNPSNDPAKGWTCDLSWDLMESLGLDPNKTQPGELFAYIGTHQLGYRIVMQNFASGADLSFWAAAVDNGLMPFAPQGDNLDRRVERPPGLQPCVAVAGGRSHSENTYGPSLEFFDAVPHGPLGLLGEDVAQSWANQMVAAKFAKILDRHPEYNIWDARQHLRQAASFWDRGWTERNGYGRVDLNATVGELMPAPPLEFRASLSRNARQVNFGWRNFPMTDFAATVIARRDGRVIYEGSGTNFAWTTDIDGPETFTYWSRNQAGEKSRIESFQVRTLSGLNAQGIPSVLVMGGPAGEEPVAATLAAQIQKGVPDWVCDIAYRHGTPRFDQISTLPQGNVVAVLQDWPAMVDFARTNRYRILVVPGSVTNQPAPGERTELWSAAVGAGIAVVTPHNLMRLRPRQFFHADPTLVPPWLGPAITVGFGVSSNLQSYGPGLEFFDSMEDSVKRVYFDSQENAAAAALAIKLARVMEANPSYNIWDARQHLRQSASLYAGGWREDGGYGRPPADLVEIDRLDLAPPLAIRAQRSEDGSTVKLSWLNFLQTDFAATRVETDAGEGVIYEGQGTSIVWRSKVGGSARFKFLTKGKSGRLSRDETYSVIRVDDLKQAGFP